MIKELTVDQWDEQYRLIENKFDSNASWNGAMFETYGKELEFIQSQPDENVWTYIDGACSPLVVAGFHLVNRIGYFVTEKQWDDKDTFVQIN
jgi:hypothetical protein